MNDYEIYKKLILDENYHNLLMDPFYMEPTSRMLPSELVRKRLEFYESEVSNPTALESYGFHAGYGAGFRDGMNIITKHTRGDNVFNKALICHRKIYGGL